MIKQILQMITVLAITLFLMAGCSTATVSQQPFDFSSMRAAESAGISLGQVVIWGSYPFTGSEAQDQSDLAWAYYYAGQVALASGDNEKAEEYFEKAEAGVMEAIRIIKEDLLQSSDEINPNLSF